MLFRRLILLYLFSLTLLLQSVAQPVQWFENQRSIENELNQGNTFSGHFSRTSHNPYQNAISMESKVASDAIIDDLIISKDDDASTLEDQVVIIDVLANDNAVITSIDPATVDLDMSQAGIQNDITITEGNFKVDGSGSVTYTPATNYNGTATLNYTVDDNLGQTSNEATITVTVTAVNDAPVITGQSAVTISATEDTGFTLSASNLVISDPDNSTFTLTILAGTDYTFSGTTVTPNTNVNGPLTVNVSVSDGALSSNVFGIALTVAAVNDAPVITDQTPDPVSATEDTGFTLTTTNLVISDPDNSTFTLTVLSGTNYTFSGNTVTPGANINGPLTVNVRVSDGTLNSNTFGVSVNVAAVNDAPAITGQNPATISATEDTDFTLTVSNLAITDPDNSTFTLTVLSGTNYTFSGNTVTPADNINGLLTVNVRVSDGTLNSTSFGVAVNVAAVNDAPTITGQTPATISATENIGFVLSVSQLVIADPDNSSFTLTVLPGTNYTFSGTTVTPATNYSGPLTVNVRVSDGIANSNTFGVAVSVSNVNDVPDITGQTPATISATEDTPFVISVSNLIITDSDDTNFTLTVLAGTNYTFSGTTITPVANYSGALTVNVRVSDGTANSNTFGVAVNVVNVNDAPVITGQTPATISATEDTDFAIALSNLVIADPDNATFTLEILAGTNYTFNQATKVVTPSDNYFGPLTVNVRVSDGALNSASHGVAVSVAAVNDQPSFNEIPDVIMLENDGTKTITVTGISAGPLESQSLLLKATSGNTALIPTPTVSYNGTAATGTISFKPTAAQTGTATITVSLVDVGLSEYTQTFQIQVTSINDAPTLDIISTVTMQEDDAVKNVALSGITAGPGETQVLDVTVSSNNAGLFETLQIVYTSPQATGTLKIKPKANAFGTAQVTVTVTDDGPNTPSPSDNNFTRVFTVNVSPVNDAPVITGQTPEAVPATEDAGFTLSIPTLIIADPDNTTFTLTILSGTNYTFNQTTKVVTPALNYNGPLTVNVKVSDGLLESLPFGVAINVTAVNDAPVITGQLPVVANENTPLTIVLSKLMVTDIDNIFPDGFSVNVLSGSNYTVDGTTITPAANFFSDLTVKVSVNDGQVNSNVYNLIVKINKRPVLSPLNFNTEEDQLVDLQKASFISAFGGDEGTALYQIKFFKLPKHGVLKLNDVAVNQNDEIPVGSISNLIYQPALNYNGKDTLSWNGSDGIGYSKNGAFISFVINPVNDPPVITSIESDSLIFEIGVVNPIQLTKIFSATDPDGDSLARAEIGFRRENFQTGIDLLFFTNTQNITGSFDGISGILALSGKASVAEYIDAIRSIQYKYSNTDNPNLKTKAVYITVNDGILSDTKDRSIRLIYTFEGLNIVNGFTPNGDGINEQWPVFSEQQEIDLRESKIRIYNREGKLMFQSKNLADKWKGSYNNNDHLLPAGSYVYTIEAIDSKLKSFKKVYKGLVNVIY